MKTIKLSNGMDVLVDTEDYEYLSQFNWHAKRSHKKTDTHYAFRSIPRPDGAKYRNGKTKRTMIQMHRELMNFPSLLVDHINGIGLDNRKENLRLANRFDNIRNSKLNKRNTSGYRGVRWHANAWRARIFVNGTEIYLGRFDSKLEAAMAYNEAAVKHFGQFARLNPV